MNTYGTAYADDLVTVLHGDCREVMASLDESSVDAIVTDPPYGLEFMGNGWDSFAPVDVIKRSGWDSAASAARIDAEDGSPHGRVAFHKRRSTYRCRQCGKRDAFKNPHPCGEQWGAEWVDQQPVEAMAFGEWCRLWATEALRVLKPGGHLLAFGGTRTWHRLACAVEDAGFEIRDSIAWMYGSGFPKSMNLKDSWQGWGTALKPAFEPIVVARKPLMGTVAENVLAHGTGALNIDGCRIGTSDVIHQTTNNNIRGGAYASDTDGRDRDTTYSQNHAGRWPANVILDESQAAELDKQSGTQRDGVAVKRNGVTSNGVTGWGKAPVGTPDLGYGGEGGASRFFYTSKANSSERPRVDGVAHPTVKPLDLMRYLVRLVTPPGGTVLEPFAGSGTTLEACVMEGFHAIGIELTDEYLPLICQRLSKPIEQVLL